MNLKWNLARAFHHPLTARRRLIALAATIVFGIAFQNISNAQLFPPGGLINRVVGGVTVDADGVARDVLQQDATKWADQARQVVKGANGKLQQATDQRHISLKQLLQSLVEADKNKTSIPEEVAFLGGLTRIEYILLYPEQNDIVFVGPAEDWTVNATGDVVGKKSGQPIMNVEDLIVAFSKLNQNQPELISCSIEPTREGSERLNTLLEKVGPLTPGQSLEPLEAAMREAFGPQQVLIEGVELDTNLAKVIFGADYQMKKIGMKLKESPVKGLPSYVDMLRNTRPPKNQSRWWMACNYNPVERSEDSLAWHIDGPGLKVLTEEEVVQSDGTRLGTGDKQALAAKWADTFTSKIDELVVKEPVIGQLRNVMDLCVAAAIIRTHGLESIANCDLSAFKSLRIERAADHTNAPSSVPPQCSFVRAGKEVTVTASGGVLVDPWSVVREPKVSKDLKTKHTSSTANSQEWVW